MTQASPQTTTTAEATPTAQAAAAEQPARAGRGFLQVTIPKRDAEFAAALATIRGQVGKGNVSALVRQLLIQHAEKVTVAP